MSSFIISYDSRHLSDLIDILLNDFSQVETEAMFTLYWIGFCSVAKFASVQCEQE